MVTYIKEEVPIAENSKPEEPTYIYIRLLHTWKIRRGFSLQTDNNRNREWQSDLPIGQCVMCGAIVSSIPIYTRSSGCHSSRAALYSVVLFRGGVVDTLFPAPIVRRFSMFVAAADMKHIATMPSHSHPTQQQSLYSVRRPKVEGQQWWRFSLWHFVWLFLPYLSERNETITGGPCVTRHGSFRVSSLFFPPISKVASCPELISVNREIDLGIALALELRTAAVEVPPPSWFSGRFPACTKVNDNYQGLQSLCVIWMREPLPFFFSSTEEEWRRVLDERERRKTLLIYFISNGCRCFRATTDIFFLFRNISSNMFRTLGGCYRRERRKKLFFVVSPFAHLLVVVVFPFEAGMPLTEAQTAAWRIRPSIKNNSSLQESYGSVLVSWKQNKTRGD